MSRRLFSALLLVCITVAAWAPQDAPDPVPAVDRPTAHGFQVFGYHAWWMRDAWQHYDFSRLDKLFFFELRVRRDGTLDKHGWPHAARPVAERAARRGTTFVPTVSILDEQTFATIFGNRGRMQHLHDAIMEAVRSGRADGVHLDFERYEPASQRVRDNLTAFVAGLRRALDAYRPGSELTMFVPAFDSGEAYDEAALARIADYLVVQGYDLHWAEGPSAGPVSPLRGWNGASWEAVLRRYDALRVPRGKIVMTVPYFGYEWPTVSAHPGAAARGPARTLTYAPVAADLLPLIRLNALERANHYGLRRDAVSRSPYYTYEGADGWYQGWFEDAESLRAKYDFVAREGLAGVAIFLLGYDAGALTETLY